MNFEELIENIAKRITIKSFSKTNLKIFRQFYLAYTGIGQTLPDQFKTQNFSFSHIVELIKLNDDLKRFFYEIETIKGNWGVRELQRQINTLFVSKYKVELPSK